MITLIFFIFFTENAFLNIYRIISNSGDNYYRLNIENIETFKQNIDVFLQKNQNIIQYVESVKNYGSVNIYSYVSGRNLGSVNDGRIFTKEELINGDNVIIIAGRYMKINTDIKIGDSINLFGEDYIIIGCTDSSSSNCYIPFNSIKNIDLIDYIEIDLIHKFNKKKIKNITTDILNTLPCQIIQEAEPEDPNISKLFTLAVIIILSIGIINMTYLYKYMLDRRIKVLGLYRIYGFTKTKTILYLYLELMFLLLMSTISGICMFAIISNINLKHEFYINNLEFGHYAFTIMSCMLFYSLCFIHTIIKFIKKTPLDVYMD